jgi:hypothetical protein
MTKGTKPAKSTDGYGNALHETMSPGHVAALLAAAGAITAAADKFYPLVDCARTLQLALASARGPRWGTIGGGDVDELRRQIAACDEAVVAFQQALDDAQP